MKHESNNLFTQLNKQEVENLITVVNETLALGITNTHRTFTAVDLWHIHRQRRSMPGRRTLA